MQRGHTTPRRIFESAGFVFAANAASRVIRILASAVVARHLGLTGYGVLAFAWAFIEVLRVASDFGVDTILVRHLSAGREREPAIGSAAALKLLLSTAAYASGIAIAALAGYPSATVTMLAVGLLGLFPSSVSNLLAAPFYASLRAGRIAWTGIAGTSVFVLLAAGGVANGQGVLYFVSAGVIADVTTAGLTARLLTGEVRVRWGGWRLAGRLLREALPVGAITLFVIGYGRFGLLFLERARGTADVGAYAIALRVTEVSLLLAGALAGSAYPALARLLSRGEVSMLHILYGGLYRHFAATATALALLLTASAAPLLHVLGEEFVVASLPLVLLAWTTVFMYVNQLSSALLLAADHGSTVLLIATWNLALNVALNLYLAPRYGALGVGAALLITEALNAAIQTGVVARRFGLLPPWGVGVRATLACFFAIILMRELPEAIPAAVLLYLAAALWSKDLSVRWVLGRAPTSEEELSHARRGV